MNKKFFNLLKESTIIIYGAGTYGKRLLVALTTLGIEKNVKYFVTSERNTPYVQDNIEVRSIYDIEAYYASAVFILAISDNQIHELISKVKELGIKKYVEASKLYPFLKNSRERKLKSRIYKKIEEGIWNKKQTVKAVHITYYMAGNAGDTVLSWCVRHFLGLKNVYIQNVSDVVDDTLIRKINEANVLVIGGGGLFLPDTNRNKISGWQWAISNEQLERITTPIIVYSVGYNYFHNQEVTELFRDSLIHLVQKASFVGLRNYGSVEAVREIVGEELAQKIEYQPCTTTLISKFRKIKIKNKKTVVFNVAFDREDRRYGHQKELILSQIANAAAKIEKLGYQIILAAHCTADLWFVPYLDKEGVKYKIKDLTWSLPEELFKFYENADVVIGMRGHAQMIPYGIGTKIISIGSHDKMRWFLEDVGLKDFYVDLNSECEQISNRILSVFHEITVSENNYFYEKLQNGKNELWDISMKNKEKIWEIIKKRAVEKEEVH